jgi:alpha-L-rhamnosidase
MLNGEPVTHAVLTPGWTDYRKTVLYDTYDVTQQLHTGLNAIGVMLGNGMYNVQGVQGRYTKFVGSFGQPKLIAELRLHYADGSTSIVTSGNEWKTTNGPILFSSIYGGEDYDASRTLTDWTTANVSGHFMEARCSRRWPRRRTPRRETATHRSHSNLFTGEGQSHQFKCHCL